MNKLHAKGMWGLILTVVFVLPSLAAALAAGLPQLELSANRSKVKVGQEVIVDIQVKEAPLIYGADVRLVFDPQLLEVVDTDKKLDGIQIEPGKFIDPAKSFELQHQVDNMTGAIDYALTLLNPAPAVQGKGQLARITFRAKSTGQATVSITEGLFGTQTGETVAPGLSSVEIEITDEKGDAAASIDGQTDNGAGTAASPTIPASGIAIALAGVLVIGVAGAGFAMGKLRIRRV